MKIFISSIALLAFTTTPVFGEKNQPVPEPNEKPEWAEVRRQAESQMRAELLDPQAAQIAWTGGFEWGYAKPPLVKRRWGWVACVAVNAKNRLGGFTGVEDRWVVYNPVEGYSWGPTATTVSQCDKAEKVPLQPALLASASPTSVPVSDQLMSIASLLEKGLITRAEFDTEKRRILDAAR